MNRTTFVARTLRNVAIALSVAIMTGCAGTGGVRTEVDHAMATQPGRTFRVQALGQVAPRFQRVIDDTLTGELLARDYQTSTSPEFIVRYLPVVTDRIEIDRLPTGPVYIGFRRGGAFVEGYTEEVRNLTEGTLYVAIVNAATDELIWEGSAHGSLNRGKPEQAEIRVRNAIQVLLADLPRAQ